METEMTQNQTPTPNGHVPQKQNPFIILGAILISFGLIAAAIYFSGDTPLPKQALQNTNEVAQEEIPPEPIRDVDENDHIRGNPNAPIVIVEYSDYDCPFCKNFHETMTKIMDEYGTTGQVAWVYRHFPIEQLHPNAPTLALASECVASLGGNDAFWKFSDRIFGQRGVNELTNMTQIPTYAKDVGVDTSAFEKCMTEGSLMSKVTEDFKDGANAGVKGTPYSLILVGGQQGAINGAQPYSSVKQRIETLLNKIQGSATTQE